MIVEPTYVYLQGQGWVCFTVPTLDGAGNDGRKYLIIARPPVDGEFYMAKKISYYPEFYDERTKTPVLHYFSELLTCYDRWELSTWDDGDEYNERFVYVTLIPMSDSEGG